MSLEIAMRKAIGTAHPVSECTACTTTGLLNDALADLGKSRNREADLRRDLERMRRARDGYRLASQRARERWTEAVTAKAATETALSDALTRAMAAEKRARVWRGVAGVLAAVLAVAALVA